MRQEAVKAKGQPEEWKIGKKSGKKNKWSGIVTVIYISGCVGLQALLFWSERSTRLLYTALYFISILFTSIFHMSIILCYTCTLYFLPLHSKYVICPI
jgi:hypothetical protein